MYKVLEPPQSTIHDLSVRFLDYVHNPSNNSFPFYDSKIIKCDNPSVLMLHACLTPSWGTGRSGKNHGWKDFIPAEANRAVLC
jgi:hypothetical protein